MTNHDALSAKVAADEARHSVEVGAEAELNHEEGPPRHPLEGLDSESLASFNLRRIRKALGVSQQQIADRIATLRPAGGKLSQTQIAKIERGERPWRVNEMNMIAEALNIHWIDFFAVTPEADYTSLEIEAARLRYEQAKAIEYDALEAWREAASVTYQRGDEYVRLAAKHGIDRHHAMKILQGRWAHQDYVEAVRKEIVETSEVKPDEVDRTSRRAANAEEFAHSEWEKLVEEEGSAQRTEEP